MASNSLSSSSNTAERRTHGSCLCGKVTFDLTGDPLMHGMCYCSNCRKTSGAPLAAGYIFPNDVSVSIFSFESHWIDHATCHIQNVDIKGLENTTTYIDGATTTGTKIHRVFCTTCGSQLFTRNNPLLEGKMFVQMGNVENIPSEWKPTIEGFTRDKPSWLPKVETVQVRFETNFEG